MKRVVLFTAAVLMVIFLACAGCTTSKPAPEPTPVMTAETPVPTTITPAPTSTPEPVVTLPSAQQITLELTKDRTNFMIHLLYNGGGGELFTQKVEMKVTRSDGTVTDYVMSNGNRPKRGDEIAAQGTRGNDRCEVWVTSGSIRYKVMDRVLGAVGAYEGN